MFKWLDSNLPNSVSQDFGGVNKERNKEALCH
jgi:hypothetical protein